MKESAAKTEELLCEVYRNLKMGSENLCSVTPNVKSKLMLRDITGQIEKYAVYTSRCEDIMRGMGVTPKEPSAMKKLMSKGGIVMNTAFDNSDSHVAHMIVSGTDMGADQLAKTLRECKSMGCSAEAVSFCDEVLSFERDASSEMKSYV